MTQLVEFLATVSIPELDIGRLHPPVGPDWGRAGKWLRKNLGF